MRSARSGSAALHVESPRQTLAWLALGALGALLAVWAFPGVFPFAPSWEVTRGEAVDIALERLRDLGELEPDPYVVAAFRSDPELETRLFLSLDRAARYRFRHSRLAVRLSGWLVMVYPPKANTGEWVYRVQVAADGGVVTALQRSVPASVDASAELAPAVARARADEFLRDQGVDLEHYDEPSERSLDLVGRRDLTLRYRDREALLGDDLGYGLEVRFSGDLLTGFYTWLDDSRPQEIAGNIRAVTLLETGWIFVSFLLLPPVAVLFVRRYHEGLVGVERAAKIFLLILVATVAALLMAIRAAAEGSTFGTLTRQQMTWIWAGVMALIYFPTIALMGFFGWSLGESFCQARWRVKLAAFDALFRGRWLNATVASAALRGTSLGLLQAGLVLAAAFGLGRLDVFAPFWLNLGPWWESAAAPGVVLLLVSLAYGLAHGLFGKLLLLPPLVDRLGPWLGGGVVAIFTGVIFFPPLNVFPVGWCMLLAVASAALGVVFFLRYDLLTALLASVVAKVTIGAQPLMRSSDPWLELQGWLALLLAALPLWVSVRYLTSDRRFLYRHDDVPPHVRRIAARERQRVELETARRIQSSILPALPDIIAGVEVAHVYLPASEVGGDFYDVLALDDGRLSVAIGDVAGHGVSSGLVMSMARSALAVQVTFKPEVEAVFTALNRVIFQSARKRLLTTLCYALVDPQQRRLVYGSAGHLYPYRVSRRGEVAALESTSYPLGVREQIDIRPRIVELDAGDSIFLSSDGLVEAHADGDDELFGFDRLEASLVRWAGGGAHRLCDGVLADLRQFAGDEQTRLESDYRRDDLTLLVLTLP